MFSETLSRKWHNVFNKGHLDEAIQFLKEHPDFEPDMGKTLYHVATNGHADIFRYMCQEQGLVLKEELLSCSPKDNCGHLALIRECLQGMSYSEKVKFFDDFLCRNIWNVVMEVIRPFDRKSITEEGLHTDDNPRDGILEVEIVSKYLSDEDKLIRFLTGVNETSLNTALSIIPGLKEMIIAAKTQFINTNNWFLWHGTDPVVFNKTKLLINILREELTIKDVERLFCYLCYNDSIEDIKWFLEVCQDHTFVVEDIEGVDLIDRRGASMDPLSEACYVGDLEMAQWLIQTYDIDINRFNHRALRSTYVSGQVEVMQWIHKVVGIDVDVLNSISDLGINMIPMVEWLEENMPDFRPEKVIAHLLKSSFEDDIIWLLRRKIPVPLVCIYSVSNHEDLQLLFDSFPQSIDMVFKHYLSIWTSVIPLTTELLEQFGRILDPNFHNALLLELCRDGCFNEMKLLLSWGSELKFEFDMPFNHCCGAGFVEQAKYLYPLMGNVTVDVMVNAFKIAASSGHIHVMKWLVEVCPEITEEGYVQQAMENAEDLTTMKYLYSLYPVNIRFDNDRVLRKAIKKKQFKSVLWILGITNDAEDVLYEINEPFAKRVLAAIN